MVEVVANRAEVIVMPDFAHWNKEECIQLAKIIRDAGGDLIKSTGGMGRKELPEKIDAVVKAVEGSIRVMGTSAIRNLDDVLDMVDAKPDKLAISRVGFFTTLDEIHALSAVRLTKEELASHLEGLIWHPTATETEVTEYIKRCDEAGLFGVSVDPRWVPLATDILSSSTTKVIGRVDYPLGVTSTAMKVDELAWVVENGNNGMEIQVPMNVAALKSGQYGYVRAELDALIVAANSRAVNVILQTPLLTPEETAAAAMLCVSCGVACVEPIHGFGKFTPDGAIIYPDKIDPNDVERLKEIVGDKIGVKATGSISRLIQALVLIDKGAERVTIPNPLELLNQYDDLVERTLKYTK